MGLTVFGSRLSEYEEADVNRIKAGTREETWESRRRSLQKTSMGKYYHSQGKNIGQIILMMVAMVATADGSADIEGRVCPDFGEAKMEQ